MPLLELASLTKSFGGLTAVKDVSLGVEQGEIRAVIGPNGAGKTSLFNLVTGIYPPDDGTVSLDGKPLIGLPPHAITRAGVGRTFQQIRLFGNMTAFENALVGVDAHHRTSVAGAILRTPRCRREEREGAERSHQLLEFCGIAPRASELARNLPYGDQRRLEIARALGTSPRVLLLDEPAAGMNPTEKASLMQFIRAVRDTGVTVVLIEHDMRLVMGVSERITVMDHGEVIAEGRPEDVQRDQRVVEAYLGKPKSVS